VRDRAGRPSGRALLALRNGGFEVVPSKVRAVPLRILQPVPILPQGSGSHPTRSRWGALGLLALAIGGAVVLYLLRRGTVTDDTYAFLDWGRDLSHGYLPLLEHRTFHPVPILSGALLSLFGSSAPEITVLASLAGFVLLAAAAWRVVEILGFPQPAPVLAAALVLSSPVLSVLAQVAYINLPFATLLLWALVFDLEGRSKGAWALLLIAGLVRPEGWAFLLAYGTLAWWRAGRPAAPRRWLGLAALSLAPMVLWLALEWGLYGDPLYSFRSTRAPNVKNTGTGSVKGLWAAVHFGVADAPLIAAALGAIAVARLAPKRLAATFLGMTVVAALTILVLASSKFNVPSRHYSVVFSLVYILAAAGAATPARLLARRASVSRRTIAAVGVLGAALVAGLSASRLDYLLGRNATNVGATYDFSRTLDQAVSRARPLVVTRGAPRHAVAVVGAVDESELAWTLGVPYNVVTGNVEASTRMIVEPTRAAYTRLRKLGLTDRTRPALPPGWRQVVATRDWEVWVLGRGTPTRLG
jgi:hypothetical protein